MTNPVTVGGVRTNVLVEGEGDPVILLHGWGASLENMRSTARDLGRAGYTAHALDLPGFGQSDLPLQTWDVGAYARHVAAYLDSQKLERVRLIGHSFGGRISIYMGAEMPERVRQIVLVDSAGVRLPPSPQMRLYSLGRTLIFGLLRLPGLARFQEPVRAALRRRFGSEDYLNAGPLAETFKAVVNQDLTPFASRIKAPVLLIWGDQDKDTPLRQAHILEKTIPDAGLVVFNGAGHYSYLDRPIEFARIVAEFFRSG